MRLSISNIAWDVDEDAQIAALLQEQGIDAIDIAPGKYFPQPAAAAAADIERVRRWWADRGIAIVGMQALLFGTTGLNVFGTPDSQQAMLDHLDGVCRIGGALQATRVVFGSPKNRDRSGLDDIQALERATDFFRRLGDRARAHGVTICLEPNPPRYGANFMTSSLETADTVRRIAHPAVRMQLDTGAMTINGEDVEDVTAACADLVGHVHISEPDLVPIGDRDTAHGPIRLALERHLPRHLATIEMVATRDEPHAASIRRALAATQQAYCARPAA